MIALRILFGALALLSSASPGAVADRPDSITSQLQHRFGAVHLLHGPVRVAAGRSREGQAVAFSIANERGYRLAFWPASAARPLSVRGATGDDLDYAVTAIFAHGAALVVLTQVSRAIPGMQDASAARGDVFVVRGDVLERDAAQSRRLDGVTDAGTARDRLSASGASDAARTQRRRSAKP